MSILALKGLSNTIRKSIVKQTTCFSQSRYSYATLRQKTAVVTENNDHIRLLFDDDNAWKHQTCTKTTESIGFFENPHFSSIYGIDFATQQAIQRAQILVERICSAPQNGAEEMRKIVKNLDRLSDTLCSVIDLAEFIRNAHPDQAIMEAANKSYSDLCSYMNLLNTDQRIHQVLSLVLADKSIVDTFTPDEHAAAIVFLRDFEKSGIHLPNKKRAEFVNLSDKIIHLGREFIQMNPRSIRHVKVPATDLSGVHPNVIMAMKRKDGYAYIPTDATESQIVLKYAHNEHIRRKVYEGMNSATPQSIDVLEQLMRTR
ncbi:Mitochondrial intermediate peptidase, partial [Rhizopus stolonifer]